ncbi:MAG: hypothetical protein ACRYG5_09990 [Janthinobacterium lividum]
MSEQAFITRRFGDAEVKVPESALFRAWLEKEIGQPSIDIRSVPLVGQIWAGQGGKNGGLARDIDGRPYWLILPPADVASFEDLEYGGYGVDEPGAKCEFDGLANTRALCESKTDHPAAQCSIGLIYEGHGDFYLPSKRESATLYANVPEEFEKIRHQTSTQYSADYAWNQLFVDGYQGYWFKVIKARVRLVRRLNA